MDGDNLAEKAACSSAARAVLATLTARELPYGEKGLNFPRKEETKHVVFMKMVRLQVSVNFSILFL
jgi:hypothetical protein